MNKTIFPYIYNHDSINKNRCFNDFKNKLLLHFNVHLTKTLKFLFQYLRISKLKPI